MAALGQGGARAKLPFPNFTNQGEPISARQPTGVTSIVLHQKLVELVA